MTLVAIGPEHADYLRDESRLQGEAEKLGLPASEDELREMLRAARKEGAAVTIQGGRTGITGGAVPQGGWVISLARLTGVVGVAEDDGGFTVTVRPGLKLSELRHILASRRPDLAGCDETSSRAWRNAPSHFFPPDPTETSATIGGMVACNASGALTYAYGATRRYVERLRVVLADGDVLHLRRGSSRAGSSSFTLETENGRHIEGRLPEGSSPKVKSAAGYVCESGMDLLDLFIGSEGTLGVFTEITLRLLPAPQQIWGLLAFFPSDDHAAEAVRRWRHAGLPAVALEFFGETALDLLRRVKSRDPHLSTVPELKPGWRSAVYLEFHGNRTEAMEEALTSAGDELVSCGGSLEEAWLATEPRDLQRLKDFRHAVPEQVNRTLDERRRSDPRLTKLGTDFAVPDERLSDVMGMYREDLRRENLEHVIFGHIGNNHLHVNILPHDLAEYERGRSLYQTWAEAVVRMGGTVSAEHGIGKLKTGLLRLMYGEKRLQGMVELKRAFDPESRLNPGNLFDSSATERKHP